MLNFGGPFWKQIVEDSLAGVYILDNELRLLYVNNVVEKATGYTKEELYLRKATDLAYSEDKKELERVAKRVFKGERVFYEGRYVRKSGEIRWVWGAITPLEYEHKIYGLGNWIDITRTKKLEEKLKESEEFYRMLIEEAIVPVYIVQGGRIVYTNKAIEDVTGYKRSELIGQSPSMLIHPEDRDEVLRRYVERESGLRDIETYSWRIIRKDGEVRWVVVRPGRITYRGKPAVAATGLDITDVIKLNEELKCRNEFLSILNRVLRHDVGNALTAIRGALEILGTENRLVSVALKKIDYIVELIRDVKALEAAIEETKPMNLAEVAKDVAKIYEKEAEIALNLKDAIVNASEALKTVLQNILHNAVVHCGKGVKVEIETFSSNGWGIVRIADYGKGIPDDMKNRIFEEGFSTGESSGLGLYIVKKIVEYYGGKIEVKDNNPSGTVFEVKLPLK